MLPFLILITRLITWLPPFRVLMVGIYKRTGSLPLVMLTHMSLVFTTTAVVPMTLSGTSLLIWLVAWSVALWGVLGGIGLSRLGKWAGM